jgi:hypothetical protein
MAGTTRLELATSAVTESFFVKIGSSHAAAFKFTSTNSRPIRPRCKRTMVSEWPTVHTNWLGSWSQARLNEAAGAADATREALGAVVTYRLR